MGKTRASHWIVESVQSGGEGVLSVIYVLSSFGSTKQGAFESPSVLTTLSPDQPAGWAGPSFPGYQEGDEVDPFPDDIIYHSHRDLWGDLIITIKQV